MKFFSRKKLSKEELVKTTRNTTIMCLILAIVTLVVFWPVSIIMSLATILWFYRYRQVKKSIA